MTSRPQPPTNINIRPLQYYDLDAIARLVVENSSDSMNEYNYLLKDLHNFKQWYAPLKLLTLFPNPYQYNFSVRVAQQEQKIKGMIQISPFNRTRSTWKVERILVEKNCILSDVGSLLLRHCLEKIWEARTWLLEVNINDKAQLALYRQNGFQPLAQLTYWEIKPEILQQLREREPDIPNLLPINNADAHLLYQLDTVAMPPLVRQVFDRHLHDFKTNFIGGLFDKLSEWLNQTKTISAYVFEPQRKAAIGYFKIQLSPSGNIPHQAELTVHPAYTWLYPELMANMAHIVKEYPLQSLKISSTDYQPEREAYLQEIGAEITENTLLMSRSVWHKLKEAKPMTLETLQLAEMLQSLQPARKPVPNRVKLHAYIKQKYHDLNSTDLLRRTIKKHHSLEDGK
ncbi:MAG TPA: GNAT family N-acetyltransferase [Allocoleopsis sp.]